jgi:hypothetical protein
MRAIRAERRAAKLLDRALGPTLTTGQDPLSALAIEDLEGSGMRPLSGRERQGADNAASSVDCSGVGASF